MHEQDIPSSPEFYRLVTAMDYEVTSITLVPAYIAHSLSTTTRDHLKFFIEELFTYHEDSLIISLTHVESLPWARKVIREASTLMSKIPERPILKHQLTHVSEACIILFSSVDPWATGIRKLTR